MSFKELDNLHHKLENLKMLSALSGYRSHVGAKRASEIAIATSSPKWTNKIEKFYKGQINIPLELVNPFLPGPSSDDVGAGDIILGILQDGSPVMLPLDLLSQNVYIVGTTGTGKTWDLIFICRQTISQGVRIWIFDRENHICKFFAEELRTNKVIVLNYKDFKRNPLEPVPGEEKRETTNRITSVVLPINR